jgi:hypothetical protein
MEATTEWNEAELHFWDGSIAAMNVAFLNFQKVIISRLYLPLSKLDSRRGFWQAIFTS